MYTPFLIQEVPAATYRNRQQHIFNWTKLSIRNNFSFGGFFNSQKLEAKTVDITVHSFGNNTLAFDLTKVLIQENINLNAAEPEKFNEICSQYDHLKDICFPDFNNNDVALVIGTDNIVIISLKTIIIENQNVPRVVLTALGWTKTGPNNDIGYFSNHHATANPLQISTDDS